MAVEDDKSPSFTGTVTRTSGEGAGPDAIDKGSPDYLPLPVIDPSAYSLEEEQGRGGLGRVLRARDRRLGRVVAVKELLSDSGRTRFLREARITARLQHPGIVPVIEAGQWPSGEPFYTMKLVSGRSLAETIRGMHTLEERLALLPRLTAVADAIAFAHSQKVVHRDLKPSNIMLGEFGETVVIDWGLAKDLTAAAEPDEPSVGPFRKPAGTDGLTEAGAVLGTPGYMPPEQARGESIDERADVYALGAILYYLLAGTAPFRGSTSEGILAAVLAGPPPAIATAASGAPRDLVTIVEKAMQRSKEARYPTASQFADDLRRFLTGQLVTARTYGSLERAGRWLWRHRLLTGATAVSLLTIAIVVAISFRQVVHQRNVADLAKSLAEAQAHELTLSQARGALATDPTAAIAWLKRYPVSSGVCGLECSIASDAVSRGVARFIGRPGGPVYATSWSGDSRFLAIGGDAVIEVLDLVGSDPPRRLDYPGEHRWIRYLRDGNVLAQGRNGAFVLWNPSTNSKSELHMRDIEFGFGLSVDEKNLIAIGRDGAVDMVGIAGEPPKRLQGIGPVYTVFYSPDGSRFLGSDHQGDIYEWDVADGLPVERGKRIVHSEAGSFLIDVSTSMQLLVMNGSGQIWVLDHDGSKRVQLKESVASARFAVDGWSVLIVRDGALSRWNPTDGSTTVLRKETTADVANIAESPDGSILAFPSVEGPIDFLSADSRVSWRYVGHGAAINALNFSKDGKWLASVSADQSFRVWETPTPTGKIIASGTGTPLRLRWSGTGVLASGTSDGTVYRWDAAGDGGPMGRQPSSVTALAIAQDGTVVTGGADGTLQFWSPDGHSHKFDAHRGPVWHVEYSPTGAVLASVGEDGNLLLYSGTAFSDRRVIPILDGQAFGLAFSPNGATIAVGGADGKIHLIDTVTGNVLKVLDTGGVASALSFSASGDRLLYVVLDGTVRVWDFRQDRHYRTEIGRDAYDAVFAGDEDHVVAVGDGRDVLLWNIATGTVSRLRGHDDSPTRAIPLPGGLIASAGKDRSLRVWNPATGTSEVLRGHHAAITLIAVAPDGATLATASADETVRRWSPVAEMKPTSRGLHEWLSLVSNAEISLVAGDYLLVEGAHQR